MQTPRLTTEERRAEILNTSLQIIHEQGIAQLTIRSIAAGIGISEAAIYRHIRDKQDLMTRLAEWAFTSPLDLGSDLADFPPEPLLTELVMRQLKKLACEPCLTAITFQEDVFQAYPTIRRRFDQHRQQMREHIAAAVQSGQKQGLFRTCIEPERFAVIYLGSMRMVVLEWRSSGFAYSLIEEGQHIIAELLQLLKTTEHRSH